MSEVSWVYVLVISERTRARGSGPVWGAHYLSGMESCLSPFCWQVIGFIEIFTCEPGFPLSAVMQWIIGGGYKKTSVRSDAKLTVYVKL